MPYKIVLVLALVLALALALALALVLVLVLLNSSRRLFVFCFVERKAPYVNGERDDQVKRTRRETSNAVRCLESQPQAKKEGKAPTRGESRN